MQKQTEEKMENTRQNNNYNNTKITITTITKSITNF